MDEAIQLLLDIREQVRSSPVAVAETLHPLAVLHAMRGEFDDARSLVREGNAIIEDLGRMYSAGLSHHEALVEMLAGQPDVAEDRLRRAYETLDEMGEKTLLATTAAMLAQAIYAQDRPTRRRGLAGQAGMPPWQRISWLRSHGEGFRRRSSRGAIDTRTRKRWPGRPSSLSRRRTSSTIVETRFST